MANNNGSLFNYQNVKYNQRNLNLGSETVTEIDANYPIAFNPLNNEPRSIIQEQDVKYEDTVYYLNVNSNDRISGTQYNFSIKLNTIYKNVKSVELISAILPNSSGLTAEPYLVLDITELNTIDFTIPTNNHRGFGVLTLKNPNQGVGNGGFVLVELGTVFHTASVFKVPKEISRLTVVIRDYIGNIYDFGSGANGSTLKSDQLSFVLKITTKDFSRKAIGLRNTY